MQVCITSAARYICVHVVTLRSQLTTSSFTVIGVHVDVMEDAYTVMGCLMLKAIFCGSCT